MKSLVRAAAIAAVTSFASWAVTRYFDRRAEKRRARAPRRSVETWENEGGALAPTRSTRKPPRFRASACPPAS